MPISQVTKNYRDGQITIGALGGGAFDAAGALLPGANSLVVDFEPGDFNLAIPGPSVSLYVGRGRIGPLPSIRYGDDAPMTFSFTARQRDLSDAAFASLEQILLLSGFVGSTWESTRATSAGAGDAEVFTVDIKVEYEGTDHGDATDHVMILPFCVVTGSIAEGDPNTISVTGTSYALYPTIVS